MERPTQPDTAPGPTLRGQVCPACSAREDPASVPWCGLCCTTAAERAMRVVAFTSAVLEPYGTPLGRAGSPRPVKSRWRAGPSTFGSTGRLVITLAVVGTPVLMIVWAVLAEGLVGLSFIAVFIVIWAAAGVPTILADVWARESVYAEVQHKDLSLNESRHFQED